MQKISYFYKNPQKNGNAEYYVLTKIPREFIFYPPQVKNPGDLENGHEFFVGTSTLYKAEGPKKQYRKQDSDCLHLPCPS